jgi:biopolymer transport protein TolQ
VDSSDLSMLTLFAEADVIVKAVMLLLLAASVWCWAIIFDKRRKFKALGAQSDQFENAYRASTSLPAFVGKIGKKVDNPMARIFLAGMSEVARVSSVGTEDASIIYALTRERIMNALQRARHKALDGLEKDMIILATVGSAAPFLGLFGTVWGIMNSFQSIAASKNTSLAVVAPGIAEALFATAIGLFAAIPAVIFYNMFSNTIRRYSGRLEDFSQELEAVLISETPLDK